MHEFKTIKGEKIYIKYFDEYCITDEYLSWLNDTEVVRFSNQRFYVHTKETSMQYLTSFANTDNLFLGIFLKENHVMIGTINAYIDVRSGVADLGIMIGNRSQWGKGMGLDAWKTLMQYLVEQFQLRKITAGTLRPNVGMVRIMEHSGMKLEAIRVKQLVLDNNAEDVLYYAKFSNG
jgi:[ribosomal protein S5]-alanine N-acetyltransferase